MNKKEWLDNLYYDLGNQQYDFRVSGLIKDKDGNVNSTIWKRYSEICFPLNPWENHLLWKINNREILPNEIVIDLEDKNKIRAIIKKLKEYKINFSVYNTYSRGYHIHIWFNRSLNYKEKDYFISRFLGDRQKAYQGSSIALEYAKHWKSGKLKEEIKWN